MRNIKFVTKEYYHIYNRGVDKRDIFMDVNDVSRFLICLSLFNREELIGSVYEHSRKELKFGSSASKKGKLVNFVAYCLNQNHYHFILEPLIEYGVQKFMHKLSTSYTNYFNEKYKRSGALFQGKYKAIHIDSNTYLLNLSAYVNLNFKIHKGLNKGWMNSLKISSIKEYTEQVEKSFCVKDIVLSQFKNVKAYKKYCEEILPDMILKKEEEKELKYLMIE